MLKALEELARLPENEFKEKAVTIVLRNLLRDDADALSKLEEATTKHKQKNKSNTRLPDDAQAPPTSCSDRADG